MSSQLDKKYVNLVSPQLDLFKWKKDNLANCRCPSCGDSQKNKTKCRGYFYEKSNAYFYRCHNCGYSVNLYTFLKEFSPALYKTYAVEKFKDKAFGEEKTVRRPKPERKIEVDDKVFSSSKPTFPKKDPLLTRMTCLNDLPEDHVCVKFANYRQIPKQHWKLLYFTENFSHIAKACDKDSVLWGQEERLVIPFFNSKGKVVAIQGRSLSLIDEVKARATAKYITIKHDKSIDRLWYGLWRVNPSKRVYAVEGPIDSLFLSNAVALVGAGALDKTPDRLANSEITYILDNEPRNRQICSYVEKLIDMGKEVCIWPTNLQEKDINDMAYRMSTRKIQKMIDANTYTGLEAKLKFMEWKKC